LLPVHPAILLKFGMFNYLWNNFHTSFKPGDGARLSASQASFNDCEDNDDDRDYDPFESEDEEVAGEAEEVVVEDESVDSVSDDNEVGKEVWYQPIKAFVEHVNKISKRLCINPGWTLSLDEMMKKFKGRSGETH
jgi:hypothetical protein